MKRSWKTTTAGVATILVALGNAGQAVASGNFGSIDFPSLIAAVTAGLGLLFARDNAVSSEDVGLK